MGGSFDFKTLITSRWEGICWGHTLVLRRGHFIVGAITSHSLISNAEVRGDRVGKKRRADCATLF